jgi:HNH endonuclease
MAAQPVEWVLVVYYGPAAHQATYGRKVGRGGYSKDYIQLSRKKKFLDEVANLFSVTASATGSVPLTYHWPAATASGAFVFKSADRPHLKWETSLGAPQVWKMTLAPSDATPETIPGDPSHLDFADAEKEFELLASRGAGQPYLMAIKLRDEPRTLHLRAYLENPSEGYAWADLGLVPQEVKILAEKTSQQSALAWSLFQSGGTAPSSKVENAILKLVASEDRVAAIDALDLDTGRALTNYLGRPGHGLFFDPTQNHDAWSKPTPLPAQFAASVDDLLQTLKARFPAAPKGDAVPPGDAAAEALEADPDEVEAFREQLKQKSYGVADATATIKTRGSAQKAFAGAVKANYEYRCAITGVITKDFLVAAHIVPWSEDQSIRLDPSNGICLSLLVDRAFEKGHLLIDDDLTIRIDWARVGDDHALRSQLGPYDGMKLTAPTKGSPQPEYLQRRRALVTPTV